jgi:hypothetical protein
MRHDMQHNPTLPATRGPPIADMAARPLTEKADQLDYGCTPEVHLRYQLFTEVQKVAIGVLSYRNPICKFEKDQTRLED